MKLKAVLLALICFAQWIVAQENIYRAEPERINDLIHTKLKVSFDFEKEQMPGEAWITLKPHFYPTNQLELDAKGMLIHQVEMVQTGKNTALDYTYDHDLLKINLGKTFSKNENYTLYINYTARPNEVKQQGSEAITDAKGLYFINPKGENPTKPTQIWTQGETESSSCWFPTIDKPNQKTTEEIYITVPDKFVTLSNGTLMSETKNNDGTRTDYWKQMQPHAPYLFYMGIGDFAVVKDTWKGKPVDYYVEHEYAPYAKEIFGLTPEMMTFFSEKFGYEYPWDKYAQMACRDYVSGAMENTTAVIHMETAQQKHGELVDENIWENTIAHELAHHWFGDLVTTESWSNLTLNESFANYSEYLWREYKYGKDNADAHRRDDLQGYLMGANFEKNLVRFHYHTREDMFDGVSYNKGGAILHMLRNYLGDDAFFTGLKKYLTDNEYSKVEVHQLRLALEEVSGKDLNWFFNQWYYGNGHPKIMVVTENTNGKVKVNLKQTQNPLFEFPLAIDVYENGKAKRHEVWVKKQTLNTFEFSVSSVPELVIVNADNDVLAEITQDLSADAYAKMYAYAKNEYTNRMQAIEALSGEQLTNPAALNTMVSALDDTYEGIREQSLNSLDITSKKVQKVALDKIEDLAQNDTKTLVKASALDALAELNDTKYIPIFENALKAESYAMQAAALNGLMALDKNKAMTLVNGLDSEIIASSPDLLAEMIPVWKAQNDTSHFDALTEMAAFYAFMPFQKPEYAKPAEDAFIWIMESDSPNATQKIMSLQKMVYQQLKEHQPMALPYVKNMAERALKLKTEAAKANPSVSIENQLTVIQQTIDGMK